MYIHNTQLAMPPLHPCPEPAANADDDVSFALLPDGWADGVRLSPRGWPHRRD
jgi:hypothetical protein